MFREINRLSFAKTYNYSCWIRFKCVTYAITISDCVNSFRRSWHL